jgi:hypothetical protein
LDTKSNAALGFLTIVENPQYGLCGGYLVLNGCGRPLEFHCTAPIKPNRAQQILYGPTLAPFLYGEQIGQTLLSKAKNQPLMVCTDREPALAVREHVAMPVALVLGVEQCASATADCASADVSAALRRVDRAHPTVALLRFQLGPNQLAVPDGCDEDRRVICQRLGGLCESFDLAEPFGRIREAIEEAQRGVR